MEPLNFDSYVDVLRERLFDYEAIHDDGTLPNFDELMSDYADCRSAALSQLLIVATNRADRH